MSGCCVLFYAPWWLHILKTFRHQSLEHTKQLEVGNKMPSWFIFLEEYYLRKDSGCMGTRIKIHFIWGLFFLYNPRFIGCIYYADSPLRYGIQSGQCSINHESKNSNNLIPPKIFFFLPRNRKYDLIGEGKLEFLLRNLFGVFCSSWPHAYMKCQKQQFDTARLLRQWCLMCWTEEKAGLVNIITSNRKFKKCFAELCWSLLCYI